MSHCLKWQSETSENVAKDSGPGEIRDRYKVCTSLCANFVVAFTLQYCITKAPTLIRIPAGYPGHWPGYQQGTCIPQRLIRVPVYPGDWSGYLQGTCIYPGHWSGYLKGTCIPLTLFRVPVYPGHCSGYLYTPGTDQDTCRVPVYTPDTDQDTCRVHVYPWHCSGYLYTPGTDQDTCRVPVCPSHWPGYPLSSDTGQGTYLHIYPKHWSW